MRTNWIIPAAAGATCPKVYTWAITSWRRFFSSTAAISNCSGVRYYHDERKITIWWSMKNSKSIKSKRTRLFDIWTIDSSSMGSPSCFSAMARFNHNFLQVKNLFCNRFWALHHLTKKKECLRQEKTDEPFPCWHIGCNRTEENQSNWNKFKDWWQTSREGFDMFQIPPYRFTGWKKDSKTSKDHFCLSPINIFMISFTSPETNRPSYITRFTTQPEIHSERTWTSYTYLDYNKRDRKISST